MSIDLNFNSFKMKIFFFPFHWSMLKQKAVKLGLLGSGAKVEFNNGSN